MTGFGAGRVPLDHGALVVQVATVNHRSCQVHVRGDLRDLAIEDRVRKAARERLVRGSVSVQIMIENEVDSAFDAEALRAAWKQLSGIAYELGAPTPALEQVVPLVVRRGGPDAGSLAEPVAQALDQALTACIEARRREGATLGDDLRARLDAIHGLRSQMAERAPLRLEPWRVALQERIIEALGQGLPDEVVARECAVQADRIDVSEELTRLGSHLEAAIALLDGSDEAVGKRLEFLVQELGREINTVGSKSNDAELTALVVEAKNLLEQIREQAANLR